MKYFKRYCYAIKRNAKGKESSKNSQKAKILRPQLFNKIKNYTQNVQGYSFVFTTNKNKERSDQAIIKSAIKKGIIPTVNKKILLPHVKLLVNSMRYHHWEIQGFYLNYNGTNYPALFKVDPISLNNLKYYAAIIEFLDPNNSKSVLNLAANSTYLAKDNGIKNNISLDIMNFFHVKPGNFNLSNFKIKLNAAIPTVAIKPKMGNHLTTLILTSLSHNLSQDPEKIYCYALRRDHVGTRSLLNDNKARILRPTLYAKVVDHTHNHAQKVSFLFSADPNKEKGDTQIIDSAEKHGVFH